MAPELFNHEGYTKEADIYSLGMILWEIASWHFPYGGMALAAIIRYVCDGNRETIPADCPLSYASLIRRCWDGRKERRPTAITVIEELNAHILDAEAILPPAPPPPPAPPLAPPPAPLPPPVRRDVVLSDSDHIWESGSVEASASPPARSAFRRVGEIPPFRARAAAHKPKATDPSKRSPT